MNVLKQDVSRIQELTASAFQQTGGLAALADSGQADARKLQRQLEQTMERFEQAALELRRLCEKHSPGIGRIGLPLQGWKLPDTWSGSVTAGCTFS